jgi:hypothetical protein
MLKHKGDLVRVREDLEVGRGVVKEQIQYAGKEFIVDHEEGFGVYLRANDFYWKDSDLILIEKGDYSRCLEKVMH